MVAKSYSEYYHQETKYSPESLAKKQKQLDWSKQPIPFKSYKHGEKFELGKYISRKKPENINEDDYISLRNLSKLLYYTNGITAIIPYARPMLLRSSPSAGGLYPTEIYVVSNSYQGLPDGIYNFQVSNHSLLKFWDKNIWESLKEACFNHKSFDHSNLCIIMTGIFYRSSWRYEERAYRRILLDTGHVLGNLTTYTPFVDKYSNLIGAFNDNEVSELLWLDKEEEAPLAIITLSDEKFENNLTVCPSKIQNEKYSKIDIIKAFHNSSKVSELIINETIKNIENTSKNDKLSFTFGEKLNNSLITWDNKIEDIILKRRSTRAYTGNPITKEEIEKIISFTYHPEEYKEQGFDPEPNFFDLSLIETYIAVTDVEGLEDGCYYYSPSKRELKQIRFKNFRKELYYLCLAQDLGRDAGIVVFHTVNLADAVKKYGERAYRYLHIDSGHLGQRLNLACIKIGLGVSGIGGFFDDKVNELLGIPDSQAVLYITTVGKPKED